MIVTMQIKFAASKSVRVPMLGGRAVGRPVSASGLTESARVAAPQPTCKETKLTTDLKELSECAIIAVVKRENAPGTNDSKITMSQGWQWCHT